MYNSCFLKFEQIYGRKHISALDVLKKIMPLSDNVQGLEISKI